MKGVRAWNWSVFLWSGVLCVAACGKRTEAIEFDLHTLMDVQADLQDGRGIDRLDELRALAASSSSQVRLRAHFLLGHSALQRSRVALELAQGVAGTRQQWVDALRLARQAEREWRTANEGMGDWALARRNAERARLWAEEIIELATSAGQELDTSNGTSASSEPDADQPTTPVPQPQEAVQQALPMASLKELEQRLDAQEQQKLNERASRPELDRVEVERDW